MCAPPCYGFALFSRYLDDKGLVLQTERALVAQTAQRLFRRLGLHGEVITKQRTESVIYEFSIKDPDEVAMLLMTFGLNGNEPQLRIDSSLFVCGECFFHFLATAFLSCGTVADPARGIQPRVRQQPARCDRGSRPAVAPARI